MFCKETNHEKRKMPVYVFLLSMVFSAVPVQAAETIYVPSKWTGILYSSKDKEFPTGNGKKNTTYLADVATAKVSNLKSSRPFVATLRKSVHDNRTPLYVTAKKAGTTNLSVKINSKTYKIKVTVKKYKNPISSIKIGNTTIKGTKFKTRSNYTLKYSKFANKKVKLSMKMAKGWKLQQLLYTDKNQMPVDTYVANHRSFKVTGGKGSSICAYVVNKATGVEETIQIFFK